MKRCTVKRLLLNWAAYSFCFSLSFVTNATAASEPSFYSTIGLGYTVYENLEEDYGNVFDGSSVEADDTFGGELSLGWQFMPALSAEILYVNFGEYSVTERFDGVVDETREIYRGEESGTLETAGLALRAELPLGDRIELFGRLALVHWEIDSEGKEVGSSGDDVTYTGTWESMGGLEGTDPMLAFGGSFEVVDDLSVYGEYLWFKAEKEKWEQTAYGLFVGLKYDFDAGPSKRPDGRNRSMTACDPKYKDISGIACE